jgi:hydrogenase maturation protein HypF
LAAAAADLLAGRILAVKGLGGYHLACDATNDGAVAELRGRKARDDKPFAVMAPSLDAARALCVLDAGAEEALTSLRRPIVLAPRGPGAAVAVAAGIAPGLPELGLMLPYTPLHHVLLARVGRPLVMTSGNLSEEPIAIANEDARQRLGDIADAFLLHDREIVTRYDDSVLRVAVETPIFLRRARGYAPLPLRLPIPTPQPLLAVGPHLKNTFTLAQGSDAYVSQHIGDLENLETLDHWRAALDAYRRLFQLQPQIVVRDQHPGYVSTRLAEELGLERVIAIQHHHAHIAAVLAEHRVGGRAVGIAFDGTGYGADGNVWGAEFLLCDLQSYRRVGQLRYARLPGGDLAARQPWRAALGYAALEPEAMPVFSTAFAKVTPMVRQLAERQIARQINAPLASSMGRLFDAAAAVLGVRAANSYEGQAAMELEALAGNRKAAPLPFPATQTADGWILDPVPLLIALGGRHARGVDICDLAAAFHESVVAAADELAAQLASDARLDTVALGGGCFQNARLLRSLRARLEARGLRVLASLQLSPNDGAISYGQAAVASALLHSEREDG